MPTLQPISLLTTITFVVLLASAIALWVPYRLAWAGLLAIATVVGYGAGVLSLLGIATLVVFAFICWLYRKSSEPGPHSSLARTLLGLAVVILAWLIALHIFPGFRNPIIVNKVLISSDGVPYTKYLNFDKTALGILILGICYREIIRSRNEWVDALSRIWLIVIVNILVVVGLSIAFGYVWFDPKWTNYFWFWALVMIFSTCLAEEALFRGFMQRELQLRLSAYRFGPFVALAASALLFGLAHFQGGIKYVVLSTVAGVGYGLAYQRSGRIEMSILAHFALNAVHFIFLTYPALA